MERRSLIFIKITYTKIMKRKIYISFLIVCVIFFVLFLGVEFLLYPTRFKNKVVEASKRYDLEPELVYAVIKAESNFDTSAVSSSGAVGLMQLIPTTARWIAEEVDGFYDYNELFNGDKNIEYGCFYLRYLFDKFDNVDVVICAYNAGETKVRDWLKDGELVKESIDYEETKNYLKNVKGYYRIYKNKDLFV